MSAIDSESLKFWSLIYSLAEWAVIFGVVLEGAEFFSRRFRRKKHIAIEPWCEKLPSKTESKLVHIFGDFGLWILVAGLVFGQIAHFHITDITGRENRRLTKQLDLTTQNASRASERAAVAEREAGESKVLAAHIGTTNAQLSLQIAQLVSTNLEFAKEVLEQTKQIQETVKTANETRDLLGDSNTTARLNETKITLAEANKVAADVRSVVTSSNLAGLKITSADRTITPEQRTVIVGILKPFIQTRIMYAKRVNVIAESSDFEAIEYSKGIASVLNESGFEVHTLEDTRSFAPNEEMPTGLEVVENGFHPTDNALEIVRAFRFAGIKGILTLDTNNPPNGIVGVNVWHKPEK
jgi:hypothetical protein